MRHRNAGLRRRCACPRREWPRRSHAWHLNVAWRGTHYRLSLDKETRKRIETNEEALGKADLLRDAIRAGTFQQQSTPTVEAETVEPKDAEAVAAPRPAARLARQSV